MGDVEQARENFTRYQQLASDQSAKDEADLHLSTLDAKRAKYDEEVDEAEDIVADLFNRAMNLTFNGSENRSAVRVKRARVKKKDDRARRRNRVGGFAIPFAYAQQQLARASEHLQVALALFPLGAEANELMGWFSCRPTTAIPPPGVSTWSPARACRLRFMPKCAGHKQDQAVKCELSRDRVRLIYSVVV